MPMIIDRQQNLHVLTEVSVQLQERLRQCLAMLQAMRRLSSNHVASLNDCETQVATFLNRFGMLVSDFSASAIMETSAAKIGRPAMKATRSKKRKHGSIA